MLVTLAFNELIRMKELYPLRALSGNDALRPKRIFFLRNAKDAVSGLRRFLATKSSLKMMKNAFYFTLKAFFLLKIFKLLS